MTSDLKVRLLLVALLLPVSLAAASGNYTFSCWKNGWRKNAEDHSADVFVLETRHYGFALDVADFRNVGLGRLSNPPAYEEALRRRAEELESLAPADLLIEIEIDGTSYRAKTCAAGQTDAVKHLASVRLWESGRFVQHYDFLQLDFRDDQGHRLDCESRLDLVAWPESLTLNLHVSPKFDHSRATLRLALNSEVGNWAQETKIDGPWNVGQEKGVSMTCAVASVNQLPKPAIAVRTENGQSIPVHFDDEKNCYVATAKRLKRDWETGYTDIRHYDDFLVSVAGSRSNQTVPFLLDLRPPANVTGVCPILCDQEGCPLGIPVQLSKNWHYEPMGSYLMAYAMLPADKSTTYRLRVVYGFYGTLPSASHAQLSLVGYSKSGGNGRWDQLAIGCWGESICFDMDMSLVDVAITDTRMLMARRGLEGRKWSWTNAGWGGDWLNIEDDGQAKYFQNNLRTAYLSQGPCLTNVQHEGYYGANQEVDFSAGIQTLRTDDYCRTFQNLSYTFKGDVSAKKISLFKLGRTHGYQTPQIAYGNLDGLVEQRAFSESVDQAPVFLEAFELPGDAPHWVALTGAAEASARNPKPNGYRALIIRKYKAVLGAETYKNPTLRVPVHQSKPANLDIELLPPRGISRFRRGDRIELAVELITLPREADDYYGPNETFRKHLTENPNSWKTTYREAKGNRLDVTVTGGKELQNYPLVIQVNKPEVSVAIKGGVGAVPICFEGLASCEGVRLHRIVNGKRILFDQAVHGNDFWQTDFDIASGTYNMTFNLPLDESKESEWILTP
ncbi:hypothetical protein [Novipirellula artificiosorum]|uniref:Uncharacterized protein n=1 Tax=Novipirellula artificiosorum TaxID=2528016 RepID=A0A5C6DAX6_9BACT|nr:hypothetical protein [Novipirellula artificiosorum]TWU34313.1 hypothetical protein Poly41_44600 [Novipirellula artificiosorum]